jgi:hypothetical protein
MNGRDPRQRERGTITVLATFLLVALFALSALAVDVGFLYTRSRMIRAVADSAVAAGMGDIINNNLTAATTDVNNVAGQYPLGAYTITPTPSANQLSVTVSATYPLYFGKIFGLSSKTLSFTAIGKSTIKTPALLALGGCGGPGIGLQIGGGSNLTITGNVESNGPLAYATGPALTNTSGFAESPCAGFPISNGGWNTISGGMGPGGPFPDPFAADPASFPPCNFGDLVSQHDVPNANWGPGGVLTPGVYCSGGSLNASSIDPCMCMVANGVSFIALGPITLGDNDASSITPAPGMPDNIVAYSAWNGAGPAVNVGFNDFTISGSIYAPNGLINVGNNGTLTVTGSLIGSSVQLGSNGTWKLGSNPAGGGGNNWQMLQ